MEIPDRTRLEPKLPATSMPSCITIELALHSVSAFRARFMGPLFRYVNLGGAGFVVVQLTTFWCSRIQNIQTGCGLWPSLKSMVVT